MISMHCILLTLLSTLFCISTKIFAIDSRYYITMGAVVDVLGGDLMATPLHWAIREGHLPMVILLIQYGYVLLENSLCM